MPPSLFEGKTPLALRIEGEDSLLHQAHYYFEYRCNADKKKRKRSAMVDDGSDELIDKAFKSRLIQKLGFGSSSDYDASLFGDNLSDSWSVSKDNLERSFTDQAVLEYMKKTLDKLDAANRKTVTFPS